MPVSSFLCKLFSKKEIHRTTSWDIHSVASTSSRTFGCQAPHWLNKFTLLISEGEAENWWIQYVKKYIFKVTRMILFVCLFKIIIFSFCLFCFKRRRGHIYSPSWFDIYVKLKEGQNLFYVLTWQNESALSGIWYTIGWKRATLNSN